MMREVEVIVDGKPRGRVLLDGERIRFNGHLWPNPESFRDTLLKKGVKPTHAEEVRLQLRREIAEQGVDKYQKWLESGEPFRKPAT